MKVLVTGGSGYLGTHARGFFDADNLSRSVGLDIRDPADARMAADHDLVIHFAAMQDKRPEQAEEVFRTNVDGTVNVLRNVRKDAAFVFASTKDVYGRFADQHDPVPETCQTLYSGQSALEWSKFIAEKYVEYYSRAKGFRAAIFRLSTVYAAPGDLGHSTFPVAYADAINKGEPLRLPGGGTPRRDLLSIDDLSEAIDAFNRSVIRFGTYNVGGGPRNTTTLSELVSTLERIMGLEAVIDTDNPLPQPIPLDYVSDLRLIDQELGWQPRIGIEAGLASILTPDVRP